MANPEEETASILRALNIPESQTDLALTAMEEDSQQGVFSVRGKAKIVIDSKGWEEVNQIFKEDLNMPQLNSNMEFKDLKSFVLTRASNNNLIKVANGNSKHNQSC